MSLCTLLEEHSHGKILEPTIKKKNMIELWKRNWLLPAKLSVKATQNNYMILLSIAKT